MSNIERVQSTMYDLFGKEFEDISTDSLQYIEYYDWNLNGLDDVSDFRIEVNDNENFFLLNKAYIECRFKVVRGDGTPMQNNDDVSPQNNSVGFFRRWELIFDDNVIESVDDAGVCNTIQSLVYFSDSYSNTIAKNQFWYPDTGDSTLTDVAETIGEQQVSEALGVTFELNPDYDPNYDPTDNNHNDPRTIPPYIITPGIQNDYEITFYDAFDGGDIIEEAVNTGYRYRSQIVANSKQFSVHIPLKNVFGFAKSYDKLLKGIKIMLRLTRASDDDVLLRHTGQPVFKLFIPWVSLWIPRVKPNISVLQSLTSRLSDPGPYYIPYIDSQIFRSSLQTGVVNNGIFQIKTKRKRPIKVFVAFQLRRRVDGTSEENVKRIFDNVGLKKLRTVLNATVQYPEREYITEFSATRSDYARVYSEFIRAGLKDHDVDQGSVVDFKNFPTLFPIFCIDMTNQIDYQKLPNSALIDIYWSAEAPADDDHYYYMWVVVEAERKMEISASNGRMKFINTV